MEFPFKSGIFGSGEGKSCHSYRKKLVKQINDLDLSSMMTPDADGSSENLVATDINLALKLARFSNLRQ